MPFIKTYHVKHRIDFSDQLEKARKVAEYAVENKNNLKVLTTKYVKQYGLHSDISCQILRKYGRDTIKKASKVNLIVPLAERTRKYTKKDGFKVSKLYRNIEYENGIVHLKPINLKFRWDPGKTFLKINQVEIDNKKFMISVTFPDRQVQQVYNGILGVDLNCGIGRSVINAINMRTGELLNLGKKGPNVRKYYYKKRQEHNKKGEKMKGDKEKRIMKDLDHKMSRQIVDYALKNKLKIVVENLKGIRMRCRSGKGSIKGVNRFVNSWSFYRLQSFIEYKSKELGIPYIKIHPHYTSQECSYCSIIGDRKGDKFVCKNKRCKVYKKDRHADINAAFNVGKRSLESGGVVPEEQPENKVKVIKTPRKLTLNLSLKEYSHAKHGRAQ